MPTTVVTIKQDKEPNFLVQKVVIYLFFLCVGFFGYCFNDIRLRVSGEKTMGTESNCFFYAHKYSSQNFECDSNYVVDGVSYQNRDWFLDQMDGKKISLTYLKSDPNNELPSYKIESWGYLLRTAGVIFGSLIAGFCVCYYLFDSDNFTWPGQPDNPYRDE